MIIDYSKFGREFEWENWFGEVDINDGDRVNTVSVEISQGEDNEIPEELKKRLEFFIENYHRYKEVLSEPIFKYYKSKRATLGITDPNDPLYPEIKDAISLTKMYTLSSIEVRNSESDGKDTIGLLYDCTWDDEGIGIRLSGFNVEKIGIQGSQY